MNPTTDVVEQRIAALEGGVAALLLSSGQAAETFAILNIAGTGDHIVSSPRLYGGTYNLLHYTLPKLGIETTFVEDPDDPASWQAACARTPRRSSARRSPTPIDILDTPAVSKVADDNGVPLIVDNTVATPYLIQPLSQGADIVVHSATKYLGGHGTAIAGVIVDGGTFDWTASGKFPGFTTPDPSYHGVVFADLGAPAYALKARVQLLRDLGSAVALFNAFLIAQGLETLSLRIERQSPTPSGWPSSSPPTTMSSASTTPGCPARLGISGRKRWRPREPVPCCPSNWPAVWKPEKRSSTGWNCTAMWPTSVTCAHW